MRFVKIAGLCFASMLMMGMTLAGSAAATTPTWLLCEEGSNPSNTKYEDNQCSKAASGGKWESVGIGSKSVTVDIVPVTLLLLDTKATGGSAGIRCGHPSTDWGLAEGSKIIFRAFKVASPKTECERVEGGCKAGEVEKMEGVDLPWKEEIFETEKEVVGRIEADGNGEPGFEVECNTLLGKVQDICRYLPGEPEETIDRNAISRGILLILSRTTGRRTLSCTQGGAHSGLFRSVLPILLPNGRGFSVPVGGNPEII